MVSERFFISTHSRAYGLFNRGAMCNFSGGLYGYENDRPGEALDLGCGQIVGHRPTIQAKNGQFISLNVPVVTASPSGAMTLQTDYNGKNEEKYINCRVTKFSKEGKPQMLGVSKMHEGIKKLYEEHDQEMIKEARKLFKNLFVNENVLARV